MKSKDVWKTVSPPAKTARPRFFYYNANWSSLIGNRPSYGSDMPLNDHHFHFGYFIRAAGEVARTDPAWAAKWKDMVLLLIRDKNPACSIEGGNTHAFMDHWIGTLHTLGINDSKVTYNHPLTTIYQKNGRKTYAAYIRQGTAQRRVLGRQKTHRQTRGPHRRAPDTLISNTLRKMHKFAFFLWTPRHACRILATVFPKCGSIHFGQPPKTP